MKLAIYGSRQHHIYGERLGQFLNILKEQGVDVVMHRKLYEVLVHLMPLSLAAVSQVTSNSDFTADAAISIGGDGTFLRTAMWVGDKEIPILGINAGHLGYLSAARIDELPSLLPMLMKGDYRTESRSLLEVQAPGFSDCPFALNEVALGKEENASMIVAATRINGEPLAEYRSDGLLVSTPTGSTAYNLSVGGPIIQPSAPAWVIAPIACHSLGMRPLVVGDDSEIGITVGGRAHTFRLSLDGRNASLPIDTCVKIRKAPFSVKVIMRPGMSFAQALREKLHWNE